MITAWTKNAKSQEEKEQFQNEVLGSARVLKRLQELLKEVETDLDQSEQSTKIYDIPNWDYRQADMNGFRRALKTVNKIINLDSQSES